MEVDKEIESRRCPNRPITTRLTIRQTGRENFPTRREDNTSASLVPSLRKTVVDRSSYSPRPIN